jgi:hypothetical protein
MRRTATRGRSYRNDSGFELGPVSVDNFIVPRETRTETDTDIHLYDRQTDATGC